MPYPLYGVFCFYKLCFKLIIIYLAIIMIN